MSQILKKKIESKQCKIVIVGMGYVGLPLAMGFAEKKFSVYGLDICEDRIGRLKNNKSYITDIPSRQIAKTIKNGTFTPTSDPSVIAQADVVMVCVPTPLKRRYTPNISFILDAVKTVKKYMKKNTLVVLESTTYPGTTEELILPTLQKRGFKVGRDFFLSFSPERIDPGNKKFPVTKIPKVVGGVTEKCTQLTAKLYAQVIDSVHCVSTPRAAEMSKLLENSFRIVNIGWINEIAMTCEHMGINVWEVIEAAKTKPFGFMPFYPGLGVGGHCIPDDPLYLFWKAKKYGFNSRFIKLAADVNHSMPAYVVGRLANMIKKPLAKARVLVIGVTYKKDVKDLRKSPSIQLLTQLKKQGAEAHFHDPLIPYLDVDGLRVEAVPLTPTILRSYDVVVTAVDHTAVDFNKVLKHAKCIFDVKNIYGQKRNAKIKRL